MNLAQPSHHVVIWDPNGEYWEGGLVESSISDALRSRGVATLPTEAGLVSRSAIGGWAKRAWGSGYPISTSTPRMACPVILHVAKVDQTGGVSFRRLSAVARLVPDTVEDAAHVRDGGKLSGHLRLAGDTSQVGTYAAGLFEPRVIDARELGPLDVNGGWTVYSESGINVGVDGYVAVGLYGAIPGARVAWAAVSQSR